MKSINWERLNQAYEASNVPLKAFCEKNNVSYNTMKNKRYIFLQQKKTKAPQASAEFKSFDVAQTLELSFDPKGYSLHGLSPEKLQQILRALHAVSL